MSEQPFQFQKLTPDNNINLDVYDDAITYAIDEPSIKNIAISGPYGSGKSSIIETYKQKHPNKNFINISLATFDPIEHNSKEDFVLPTENNNEILVKPMNQPQNLATTISTIEGKILNQLLHKIDPNNIPQTIFKTKSTINEKNIIKNSIIITIFIALVFYLKNIRKVKVFIDYFVSIWHTYSLNISIDPRFISTFNILLGLTPAKALIDFTHVSSTTFIYISYLIAILLCLLIFFHTMYQLIKKQKTIGLFKSLTVQGNKIELFEKSDESFFDKYLNEVLYLFENCGAEAIIFEDIDRFDIVSIFERLREINELVNERSQKNLTNTKISLKFIYLVKDDLFSTKDRTKFFDFIIPIIPVIDTSNSYSMLVTHLDPDQFEKSFLKKLCLYIDDMRLLKNIINEFYIYKTKLEKLDLNKNKLLAIITYKNIFPEDFNSLQFNGGYVYNVLESTSSIDNNFDFNQVKSSTDTFLHIKNNKYFDLIKFLLRDGFIDAKYFDYMSNFYNNILSYNDKLFIRSITDNMPKDLNFKLTNCKEILSSLRKEDFKHPGIINYNFLLFLLDEKHFDEFLIVFENQIFISDTISLHLKKYYFRRLFSNMRMHVLIQDSNPNTKRFILKTPHLFHLKEISEKLLKNLDLFDYKFEIITDELIKSSFFDLINELRMYEINFENIKKLINLYKDDIKESFNEEDLKHRNFTLLLKLNFREVTDYIQENIFEYLTCYINFCEGTIKDEEWAAIEMINIIYLKQDYLSRYLKCLETKIENISKLKSSALETLISEEFSENHDKFNYLNKLMQSNDFNENVKIEIFEQIIDLLDNEDIIRYASKFNLGYLSQLFTNQSATEFTVSIDKENTLKKLLEKNLIKNYNKFSNNQSLLYVVLNKDYSTHLINSNSSTKSSSFTTQSSNNSSSLT